jgi:MFS family permease
MPQSPSFSSNSTAAAPHTFWFLFVVSFIEGGAVMAVELVGAKIVGPFYGNSLYVWAAVLALTLGGLTTGYLAGGALSKRYPRKRTLYIVMLASAVLVAVMPWTAGFIMQATLGLELRAGITVSCLVFLFPPLVCFGMVSPLIIRLVTSDDGKVGVAAGTVYAVSTVGGILATYSVAFYAIPSAGMRESLLVVAALLAMFPLLYFTGAERRITGG